MAGRPRTPNEVSHLSSDESTSFDESPRSHRGAELETVEKTRWWAIGIALAVTAVIAYLTMNYYRFAVPTGQFSEGVTAIRTGDWVTVQRATTALTGQPDFQAHRSYLQAALELERGDLKAAAGLLEKAQTEKVVRPYALAMLGVVAYQQGDLEQARQYVEESLAIDPEQYEATELAKVLDTADQPLERVARAARAIDAGDVNGVERELKALQASPDGEPYADFIGGLVLMRQNEFEQALRMFGGAKDHPDLRARTLTLAGEALYRLGQIPAARAQFIDAVLADDEMVDAHRWLSVIYYDQGANDHAVVHLRRVAELDPTDPRPDRLLGQMNFDFQDFETAIEHYDKALARNPPVLVQAEILLEKAQCLVKLRRFEEATKTLDEPLVESIEEPSYARLRDVTRAECELDAGSTDQAAELIDRVLAAEPTNRDALVLKGSMLLAQGDTPRAVQTLERATFVDRFDYLAHFQLGLAYRAAGREPEARATQQRAEQLRQLREVFSQLHQQAAEDLTSVDVRYQLGETAMAMGRADLAAVWYAAVLQLQPDHPQARTRLEELAQSGALQPPMGSGGAAAPGGNVPMPR